MAAEADLGPARVLVNPRGLPHLRSPTATALQGTLSDHSRSCLGPLRVQKQEVSTAVHPCGLAQGQRTVRLRKENEGVSGLGPRLPSESWPATLPAPTWGYPQCLPPRTPVLLGPGVQGPDVLESLEASWAEGPALDCVHLRYFGHTKNPLSFLPCGIISRTDGSESLFLQSLSTRPGSEPGLGTQW